MYAPYVEQSPAGGCGTCICMQVEEKAKTMKDIDIASLDSRLREEVQKLEVLEVRCRYLPKA